MEKYIDAKIYKREREKGIEEQKQKEYECFDICEKIMKKLRIILLRNLILNLMRVSTCKWLKKSMIQMQIKKIEI